MRSMSVVSMGVSRIELNLATTLAEVGVLRGIWERTVVIAASPLRAAFRRTMIGPVGSNGQQWEGRGPLEGRYLGWVEVEIAVGARERGPRD